MFGALDTVLNAFSTSFPLIITSTYKVGFIIASLEMKKWGLEGLSDLPMLPRGRDFTRYDYFFFKKSFDQMLLRVHYQ